MRTPNQVALSITAILLVGVYFSPNAYALEFQWPIKFSEETKAEEEPVKKEEDALTEETDVDYRPSVEEEVVAEEVPGVDGVSAKDGLSIQELEKITSRGSFEVNKNGDEVSFAGVIPARCAKDALPPAYLYEAGKHIITLRLPNCENGFKWEKDDKKVSLSSVFGAIKLQDESGEIVFRHFKEGDEASKNRIQDNVWKDAKGNPVKHISTADIEAEETTKLVAANKKERERQFDELAERIGQYCEAGNFEGLTAELEAQREFFGDISKILADVGKLQNQQLEKDLEVAETPDDAVGLIEAYKIAARSNGWDEDALDKKYIERRVDLINSAIEDLDENEDYEKVAKMIREFDSDLRSRSRTLHRENRDKVAALYAEIGTYAANHNDLKAADRYFEKAHKISDSEGKTKIDAFMAKEYASAFKKCVEKDASKMKACEDKFYEKSRNYAERIKNRKENAADSSDEDAAASAEYNAEFAAAYGAGPYFQYAGFGMLHPYLPSAFETFKRDAYMKYMQEQQMKAMMPGGMPQRQQRNGSSILGI
ncbi:MAG: hypothetical protein M9962_05150 [Oligoflexia bacterium]|nr:hypothetical protein [Oligoflexia bacterium]